MMAAPLKPWERNAAPALITAPPTPASTSSAPNDASVALPDAPPSLPNRPTSLSAPGTGVASTSTALTPYQQPLSAYSSPYGGMSAYSNSYSPYSSPYGSSFTSPYSRFGSYGAGSYGAASYGAGSYGSYNPYGAAPFGANPLMPGQNPFDPNNASLTQRMEASTSQTFALLSSLVQTFGSFAQMLESTYMATHSSFFAMIGVADQFSSLRRYLGEVLGVFSLLAWTRGWLRGERTAGSLTKDFRRFLDGAKTGPDGSGAPRPSRKPLIVFLLAAFGLPYLMHKLVNILSKRAALPPMAASTDPNAQNAFAGNAEHIDPSTLTFARAMYPFETADPVELPLAKDEIVAVLSKLDPVTGVEGEWWRGRTRDGRTGWFPRKWVEIIRKGADDPPMRTA